MLTCPKGHSEKTGRYCDECGAELLAAQTGDSLRIRSPEAHAAVNLHMASQPAQVECELCGQFNPISDTFNCRGGCGKKHLCKALHFDKTFFVCSDCANERRGVAQQEAARQAKLLADLADWRGRAERAEAQLAEISRKEREAEAARQAELRRQREEAEAAARRAAEAAKQQPVWQGIGIELLRVPAGEFLYGENKQKISLPAFAIAKTPVTNAQYKAFVDATGYQPPGLWTSGQIPKGKKNHPVVYVSWDDAQAFCAWAGVRLPTEQEWEKAARGTDGREYPWGAWRLGRCNSSKAKIGDTSPVDRFPSGASPYGLLNMAGNVWEWCADWYDSSQRARVWRGGSFRYGAQDVRCAFRIGLDPGRRDGGVGFRVASPGL